MKTTKISLVPLVLVLLLTANMQISCNGRVSRQEIVDSLFLYTEDSEVYYDLKKPVKKYFLPYVLSEVSGLTYFNPDKLLMIEDEGGAIYEYDLISEKIKNRIKFADPGDFEGVEMVGDKVYAIQSNGDLYEFDYTEEDEAEGRLMETAFSKDNNIEGLGYDPIVRKLLIATKEDGDIDSNKVKGKAVYRFDPIKEVLDEKEVLSISNKDLDEFFEGRKGHEYEEDKFKFEPSAIAFHPIEKTYYVLASVGKMLLVYDRNGKIKTTYPILPRILNQPEGICFAPNGDLYISSEGEGDRGFVLKFDMLRK